MADPIHPNEHGYGVLAQEIYMRLAFSHPLKQRINQIYESNMTTPELQNFMAE
jgi:hypothetical protein